MPIKSSLLVFGSCAALVAFAFTGCQSNKEQAAPSPATTNSASMTAAETPKPAPVAQPAPVPVPVVETKPAPAPVAEPASVKMPIRINAGSTSVHTNANGDVWLADTGFDGGDSVDRGSETKIANTD